MAPGELGELGRPAGPPPVGQGNRRPRSAATSRRGTLGCAIPSGRWSASFHGGLTPKPQARILSSSMVSPLVPNPRSPAPCSRPSRKPRATSRRPRAILDRCSTRRLIRRIETRRWFATQANKGIFSGQPSPPLNQSQPHSTSNVEETIGSWRRTPPLPRRGGRWKTNAPIGHRTTNTGVRHEVTRPASSSPFLTAEPAPEWMPRVRPHAGLAAAIPPLAAFLIAGLRHGAAFGYIMFDFMHAFGLAFMPEAARRRSMSAFALWWATSLVARHVATAFTFVFVTASLLFFSLSGDHLAVLGREFMSIFQ